MSEPKNNTEDIPKKTIRLTKKNITQWPKYHKLLKEGKVKFDSEGQLRYLHGAPVGDLVLIRENKDGKAKYKESGDKWFSPDSPKAKAFKWG